MTQSLAEALDKVEAARPGAFWLLSKGRLSSHEPLYGFQILFGTDEVLASGEADTAEAAIDAALATLEMEQQ